MDSASPTTKRAVQSTPPSAARAETRARDLRLVETAPPRTRPDPFRWALVVVLRGGVLLSAALLAAGMGIYFVTGAPQSLAATAASSHPFAGLASAGAVSDPIALISFGLFVLVSLPIARVALSLFHFVKVRDRLYVVLTTAVLAVLMVGIIWGKAI